MTRTQVKPYESFNSRVRDVLDFLFYGPFAILRHIRVQLTLIGVMFGFGTLVFMHYQALGPLAAFTASVSTITTIGIYAPNIVSMPPVEQVIMVVMFIVSVGLAASLVQSIVATAVSREILREELALKRVARLRGHIVVAGDARLREEVTECLAGERVSHVVLTSERETVRYLLKEGVLAVYGRPADANRALRAAGIQHARVLVCSYDDDGDNLLLAMNARKINRKVKIISSVLDRSLLNSLQSSDVDQVLPLLDVTSHVLVHSAVAQEVVGVFIAGTEEQGYPLIAELTLEHGGRRLRDLDFSKKVIMILRRDQPVLNPQDDFVLEVGDLLYVYLPDYKLLEQIRASL